MVSSFLYPFQNNLKNNKHVSLHTARKYVRKFTLHVPVSLSFTHRNSQVDSLGGQISEHNFQPKVASVYKIPLYTIRIEVDHLLGTTR